MVDIRKYNGGKQEPTASVQITVVSKQGDTQTFGSLKDAICHFCSRIGEKIILHEDTILKGNRAVTRLTITRHDEYLSFLIEEDTQNQDFEGTDIHVYLRDVNSVNDYTYSLAEGITHLRSDEGGRLDLSQFVEGEGIYEVVLRKEHGRTKAAVNAPYTCGACYGRVKLSKLPPCDDYGGSDLKVHKN